MKKTISVSCALLVMLFTMWVTASMPVMAATSTNSDTSAWPWSKYMSVSFSGTGSAGSASCTLAVDATQIYTFSYSATGGKLFSAEAKLVLKNVSGNKLKVTYGDGTQEEIAVGSTITRTVSASRNSTQTGSLAIKNVEPIIEKTFTASITDIIGSGNITSLGVEKVNLSSALATSESVTVTTNSSATLSYTVDAGDGYVFFGFKTADNTYICVNDYWSTSAKLDFSTTNVLERSYTSLVAVFVPYSTTVSNSTAAFEVDGNYYPYLDVAVGKAKSGGGKVVAVASGLAQHSSDNGDDDNDESCFTIPSTVTLVLPYALGTSTCDASTGKFPYGNYAFTTSASAQLDPSKAWLTLQIGQGMYIVNNGVISIGGKLTGESSRTAGATVAGFARLILAGDYTSGNTTYSQLKMGANSVLSVCGYITGSGTIDATATGVKIYEPLVIPDYRGGGYVTGAAADAIESVSISVGIINYPVDGAGIPLASFPGGEYLFPISQYSLRNIQVDIKLGGSSTLYSYIVLYTTEQASGVISAANNQSTVPFVGAQASSGLFQMATTATAYISYDPDVSVTTIAGKENTLRKQLGRTCFVFEGDVAFGSISLTVKVLSSELSLSSSLCTFFVPYNFSIQIQKGATFTITENLAMLPGAEIVVEPGATLDVKAKFFVMDGLYEQTGGTSSSATSISETTYSSATGKYPQSSDLETAGISSCADLIINGTLKVSAGGSLAGPIQSTVNGATIDLTSCTQDQLSAKQQIGLVGSWTVSVVVVSLERHFAGATLHQLDAMVYSSATGELVKLEAGKLYTSYYGNLAEDGTYSNIISYDKTSFQQIVYMNSAYPTAAVGSDYVKLRTLDYSATILGEWYTEGQAYAYRPQYRVQDYVWLNATFTPTAGFATYFNTADAGDGVTDGVATLSDGSQIVCVGGVYYHVRKMKSDDLGSASLTVTANGQTINMTFDRAYDSLDPKDENYAAKKDLIDKMIAYGQAADLYFDGVDSDPAPAGKPSASTTFNPSAPAADAFSPITGVALATKGASVYFPECLRLGVAFALKEGTLSDTTLTATDGKTYTVLQMGLLVGNPGFTAGTLKTNPECYDDAILLYDGVNSKDDITDGDAGNYPNTVYPKDPVISVGSIPAQKNGRWTAIFDIPSLNYTKQYNVRPFMVVEDADGKTYCIYGAQYVYGLKDYVARQYTATTTNQEFKNLLYYTWEYAVVAQKDGAFAE